MIDRLIDRLLLSPAPDGEPDVFVVTESFRKASAEDRVFGGQLAGQMLLAAAATVDADKSPICIRVDYLTYGEREAPLRYEVERTVDGRTPVRRVLARQGRAIATGSVTFQPPGDGFSHQHPMPAGPAPDELDPHGRMDGRGFLVRSEDGHDPFDAAPSSPRFSLWWRTDDTIADSPLLHQAVLCYISDLTMTAAPFRPIDGFAFDRLDVVMSATINNTIWFHRPFRVDSWLRHDHDAPSASEGRALATSTWFTEDGELVASCAQQTLSRLR